MSEFRLDGLVGSEPALAVALEALVHTAGDDGRAPLGELVTAFRTAYASADPEGGVAQLDLSGDQIRENLGQSVLPRLVEAGWITWDPELQAVAAAPWWWSAAIADRNGTATRFRLAARSGFHRDSGGAPVVVERPSVLGGRGLMKSFKRRAVVNDVSVEVRQGEIVGLLGPNGAGKTTTFYLLTGLILADAGVVTLDGRDITRAPMYERARAGLGYLAQEPSIFRRLTVEENVMAVLETLPLPAAERQRRLETMLDELSIKHLRHSKAYALSGGERRRLEITRALVSGPKFMLLDEPFAGVDPIAVHDIQTIVAGLRHRGIGVLITDHNVEQTLDIVDRAYIMFEGKVQVEGSVRDLVFDDRVAQLYFGPTLTGRLRARLTERVG
ncbi:MAG TPA: LPS export ABC transporter ATP-binding protein [Gemmatimonadales bacterium]|nr:LPS export ABC transporter ATP-binding protein [Gemmatimonadales bacterium]